MAGIYIHIPFCKKICYYCDFYKSANYHYLDSFTNCIIREIALKKNFTDKKIETIYFGGGTPSSINIGQIELIVEHLFKTYDIKKNAEISFEVNPMMLT